MSEENAPVAAPGDRADPTPTGTCLLCGARLSEHWASATDIEYLTTADRFDYWHCADCDCLSIDPLPVDRLAKIYPADYYSFAAGDEAEAGAVARSVARVKARLDRRTFRRILALSGSDAPSILDVGGGTGELAASFAAAAPGARATVVDIDPASAEVARQRGLGAVVSRFEEVETDERFDVILMLNLIEHVADPRAVLVKARELLAPGGVVWIQTPDFHGLDGRIFRHRNWAGYHCPRHWAIFGRDGLRTALVRAGLEPVELRQTQAGAFWSASLLGQRRRKRLAGGGPPPDGEPLVRSPLFAPLAALGAAFDFVTSPIRRTSQIVTIARDNVE